MSDIKNKTQNESFLQLSLNKSSSWPELGKFSCYIKLSFLKIKENSNFHDVTPLSTLRNKVIKSICDKWWKNTGGEKDLVYELFLYPVFSASFLSFTWFFQSGIVCRYSPSPTIPRTSNLCITSLEAGFLIQSNSRRATEEELTGASGRRGYGLAWGGLVWNHGKERITERLWAWWWPSHTHTHLHLRKHKTHHPDVSITGHCYTVAECTSLCGC